VFTILYNICYTAEETEPERRPMKLEIKKIGNSTGLILPKELLAELNLQQGDSVYVSRTPDRGLVISRYDPAHEEAMEVAREAMVIDMHGEQLALFGGPPGIRDQTLLSSAIGRPRNKWAYEQPELPELAAAYAFGIAKNHPFVDGNKRAAFVAMMVFLRLNGVRFAPPPPEATAIILDLAAGEVEESGLARWIRDNLP
jgi:death-on-curing protein